MKVLEAVSCRMAQQKFEGENKLFYLVGEKLAYGSFPQKIFIAGPTKTFDCSHRIAVGLTLASTKSNALCGGGH